VFSSLCNPRNYTAKAQISSSVRRVWESSRRVLLCKDWGPRHWGWQQGRRGDRAQS